MPDQVISWRKNQQVKISCPKHPLAVMTFRLYAMPFRGSKIQGVLHPYLRCSRCAADIEANKKSRLRGGVPARPRGRPKKAE